MMWSQVLGAIKVEQAESSLKIAAVVRKLYNDQLEELFKYKCSYIKTWVVWMDSHAIAQ